MKEAIISFGSNLGDLGANLIRARESLEENGYLINRCSGVYLTPALGFESDNDFYNAVVEVVTLKEPEEVLHDLLKIEQELGRIRHTKSYTDRIIDLDLIAYSDVTKFSEHLTLPHPRYHLRLFILIPLRDIRPTWYDKSINMGIEEMISLLGEQETPQPISLDICAKSR